MVFLQLGKFVGVLLLLSNLDLFNPVASADPVTIEDGIYSIVNVDKSALLALNARSKDLTVRTLPYSFNSEQPDNSSYWAVERTTEDFEGIYTITSLENPKNLLSNCMKCRGANFIYTILDAGKAKQGKKSYSAFLIKQNPIAWRRKLRNPDLCLKAVGIDKEITFDKCDVNNKVMPQSLWVFMRQADVAS